MNGMDIVENRIKSLIQKSAVFFPWADKNTEIMSKLVDSIQHVIMDKANPAENVPHRFTIRMNSKNFRFWQENHRFSHDLVIAYEAIISEYGIKQNLVPDFTLVTQNSLNNDEIQIEVIQNLNPKDITNSIEVSTNSGKVIASQEYFPVLLFGEEKEIQISSSVITIGRRECNDIVIDDIRISRLHAQIRKVPEGYMIFDTGSTGGTFVNNARISQKILQSGDVISLGGYKFIYLNENIKTMTDSQNSGAST